MRVDRLAEAIRVLKGCWGDGPLTHDGEHYRVDDLDGRPVPLTPGGPPIVVGGGGPRVLRLAGREADIVGLNVNLRAGVIDERAFPDGTPASTDRKVAWVRDAAGDRADEIELQVRVHLAMVTDDREAWSPSSPRPSGSPPPRPARRRTPSSGASTRSAISWSSAASDGASATSACPRTSSTPSPPYRRLAGSEGSAAGAPPLRAADASAERRRSTASRRGRSRRCPRRTRRPSRGARPARRPRARPAGPGAGCCGHRGRAGR